MTPLITLNHPMRINIEDLPQWIDPKHTAAPLLVYLVRRGLMSSWSHDRDSLIVVQATLAPHKAAAFEYNLMRINDSLPLAGWLAREMSGRYFMCAMNDIDFGRVVERHRRRYG